MTFTWAGEVFIFSLYGNVSTIEVLCSWASFADPKLELPDSTFFVIIKKKTIETASSHVSCFVLTVMFHS